MFNLPGPLGTFVDFLIIAIGFGLIVFVHELGHFLAAKWAGIRVLAFSIGFGNVLCSYRKGIGFRMGSSDAEYRKRMSDQRYSAEDSNVEISPTEYRFSMLPLGGYVKMLGQEDLNPDAVSEEPDSYQNCPVPKRLVVISAGVIMNVIMAALLFIFVFHVGREVFPSKVGYVMENSPASTAVAVSHEELAPGLLRGDRILEINNWKMLSFEHIQPEIAMSSATSTSTLLVERDGIEGVIEFEVKPEKSERTGLLDIGIMPSVSNTLFDVESEQQMQVWSALVQEYGLVGLEPGDTLLSANGRETRSPFDLLEAAQESDGLPLQIVVDRKGEQVEHVLHPVQAMSNGIVERHSNRNGEADQYSMLNTLGLAGVMMVNPNGEVTNKDSGLMPGDIFARIGSLDFPILADGVGYVQSSAGQTIQIVVLRQNEQGDYKRVSLDVKVGFDGRIGFLPAMSTTHTNFVSAPVSYIDPELNDETILPSADSLMIQPGSRIVSVGGSSVTTLRDVSAGIVKTTEAQYLAGEESFEISLVVELPLPAQPDGTKATATKTWTLQRAEIETLRELGWTMPGSTAIASMFQYETFVDKADGPVDAISRGVSESRRVMLQTYITFLRLFQGSVSVKNLKGPVGIAHLGTQIASQGMIWVLFFMALISINLAVINFLPLPIVDGGQFLMLLYEWVRGKPVPIVFQNVTTLAGLLFIGSMFLYVTFYDVKALFGI